MPDGTIELRPTEAARLARQSAAVDQSLEIVRRRIDERGVAEPTIQRLGPNRILVQLPGVQDPTEIRKILKSTAKLSFHRVLTTAVPGARLPPGYEMLPASSGGISYPIQRQPMLAGIAWPTPPPASISTRDSRSSRSDSTASAPSVSPRSRARMWASRSPSCSTARC